MLLSQELSAEVPTDMVGKRFTEVWRPDEGSTELEAGPVGGAGPLEEVETIGRAGPRRLEVEPAGEAGPAELEAGSVSRQRWSWPTHSSPAVTKSSYPGSMGRPGQPPPSRDLRLLLPSSEDGFRRSRRPPAAASSMSPSSNRRVF